MTMAAAGWYGANTCPEVASSGFEWSPEHAASGDARRIISGGHHGHQNRSKQPAKSCFQIGSSVCTIPTYIFYAVTTDTLRSDLAHHWTGPCRLQFVPISSSLHHYQCMSLIDAYLCRGLMVNWRRVNKKNNRHKSRVSVQFLTGTFLLRLWA